MNDLNKSFTNKNPFKRIYNAFFYSVKGFKAAFKSEQAFRINFALFIVNSLFALNVHDKYFCVWLLFCGIFVIFSELINTAIEYIVDRIGSERNPLSGSAKDIGSALVFLALLNLSISWAIFLFKN